MRWRSVRFSGALRSAKRTFFSHLPSGVRDLPLAFQPARRTSSTARPARATTETGQTRSARRGWRRGSPSHSRRTCRSRPRGSSSCAPRAPRRTPAGLCVAARRAPHDPARAVVCDVGHVALPAPVGQLVTADLNESGQALIEVIGHDALDDPPDGIPGDPQQRLDLALGHLLRAERHEVLEVARVAGVRSGPRTASTLTPQSRHSTRRNSYSMKHRRPARSRCRQRRRELS